MNTLRALKQSLGLGAVLAAGTLLVTGVALATPGNDNSGGSPGNPHVAGTKGNPHAPGTRGRAHTQQATGNPHSGAPPYGVANARSASSSSSAGPTVAADHRNRENGNSSVDRANN